MVVRFQQLAVLWLSCGTLAQHCVTELEATSEFYVPSGTYKASTGESVASLAVNVPAQPTSSTAYAYALDKAFVALPASCTDSTSANFADKGRPRDMWLGRWHDFDVAAATSTSCARG